MSTAIRLLVAIDGSKSSERTLQALTTQFSPTGTTVRVLNVVEPTTVAVSPQMAAGYAPELEARLKDARALVERAANTLGGSGFKVATEVRQGDIREMIIESAKDWSAELIVVGSHGQKRLPRLLLGSVAEAVVRHASCSVEVVRTSPMFPKVLLVVDDSKFSDAAAQAVIRQVRQEHADVRVLHVVDLQLPIPTSYAVGFRQESLNHGKELARRVEQELSKAGFDAEGVIEEGDPRSTIVDYAKKWGANLIVAGSHGRKGLE
jgi:nucleotide-binding universal stress UspA family protein